MTERPAAANEELPVPEPGSTRRVHVAVGVILDSIGQVLVARRAEQQHLGGLWEFPGGKLEPGETVHTALCRELKEELDIEVEHSRPLCRIEHNYPGKAVLLDVWIVDRFKGTPRGIEHQPLRWLPTAQLDPAEFPQANRLIIRRLQLSDRLAIIDLPAANINLPPQLPVTDVLLRLRCWQKDQYSAYLTAVRQTIQAWGDNSPGIILDLSAASLAGNGFVSEELCQLPGLKGLHVHGGLLQTLSERPVPEHLLLGVSCHDQHELELAAKVDADYALLSPVKATATHPDVRPLGWDRFQSLAQHSTVPVYALGGMQASDLITAHSHGGRGIAGIRLFNCDTMR
ncbi:Nudix family hydrolase [Pseudohongiella acticola]|uniref:Nudix family hydrolase n=1 Tax=Pseudohongiella acticola TaxID=1524254 RepID=UPI0009F36F23|nr:Nudix family hydrolase [Pseudohongiella acticola]